MVNQQLHTFAYMLFMHLVCVFLCPISRVPNFHRYIPVHLVCVSIFMYMSATQREHACTTDIIIFHGVEQQAGHS